MAIIEINSISQIHAAINHEKPRHPLVTVIDFSKVEHKSVGGHKMKIGFYGVMLKNKVAEGKFRYGREYYDFQDGTILFLAPEQVVQFDEDADTDNMEGWGLFFHPDFLRRSSLAEKMKDYSFFSYEANEALHLSDQEKQTLADCIHKIEVELAQNIDVHSQTLILSNIELLLNYCNRYYGRQFITRSHINKDVVSKFERLLTQYFDAEIAKDQGLPSVAHLAAQLNLSPNYLSDLLKRDTGKNAQEHIHYHLIEKAKTLLLNSNGTISEVAYNLGFEYPQYFSKIFKLKTGMTPVEYRGMN